MNLGRAMLNRRFDSRSNYVSIGLVRKELVHIKGHERNPHRSTIQIVVSLLTKEYDASRESYRQDRLGVGCAGPVKITNYVL